VLLRVAVLAVLDAIRSGKQLESAMLEPLAGRLKWERTGSGIRVEIPAQSGWLLAFLFFWLILWGGIGGTMVVRA